MNPALDMAQARADLADAALALAETLLHAMALVVYPPLQRWPVHVALASRHLEAAVEHPANKPLAQAYGRWRTASRQASKARSVLLIARLDAEQRSELRKSGLSIAGALTAEEVLDGLQERRAA